MTNSAHEMRTYAQRVERGYILAGLPKLLAQIRSYKRYENAWGVNVLTTGRLGDFCIHEAQREIVAAAQAGSNGDTNFQPRFSSPLGGLSYGLNPYSDWTMSLLDRPPTHTYLFLGLDFYDIAALGQQEDWASYLENPFMDRDPFWHRLWAWILNRTVLNAHGKVVWQSAVSTADAASFVRSDGGAFTFHNLIPYLRPAGIGSTDPDWPKREWKKQSIQENVIEDLYTLRNAVAHPITAYCTSTASTLALHAAGFAREEVVCWGAHPSKVFHPSILYPRGLRFRQLG